MALPTTGPLAMSQVRSEMSGSGAISLGSSAVRDLAGILSGKISMSDLRGKSDGALLVSGYYSTTVGPSVVVTNYGYIPQQGQGSLDSLPGAPVQDILLFADVTRSGMPRYGRVVFTGNVVSLVESLDVVVDGVRFSPTGVFFTSGNDSTTWEVEGGFSMTYSQEYKVKMVPADS